MKTLSSKIIWLLVTLLLPLGAHAEKSILVFGDSLSAGYGIAIEKSWVNLLQQELNSTQSGFGVANASISGETSMGGRRRIAQALKQHRPFIVIVELGANDGLRGNSIPDLANNLGYIIEQAQGTGARVLLVGMRLPPNYGITYTARFHNVYPQLSIKYHIPLLPFLLEGVPPEQFQADNLHPTAAAQAQIMHRVLRSLTPLLK